MPPSSTAWTSDRLRPKHQQQRQNKSSVVAADISKSPKVRQLERLVSSIEALSSTPPTRDPRGGCFCLARDHPLSPYTPLCSSCGLILCSLNSPWHLCPSTHCPSPTLLPSPDHRTNLLANLRHQLSTEIQKEEDLKLQLAEEKKRQAGAFPSLQSTTATTTTTFTTIPKPVPQATHKVLSITSSSQSNKKKKKIVTVSSRPSPSSSLPPSRTDSPSLSADDDGPRIPQPPSSVIHALSPPHDILKSRPWRNYTLGLDDDDHLSPVDIKYIPVSP